MKLCKLSLPEPVLYTGHSRATHLATARRVCSWSSSHCRRSEPRLLRVPQPLNLLFITKRRTTAYRPRPAPLSAAAWAGDFQTAASSSFDLEDHPEGSSKFEQLCHSQLRLVSTVLQKPDGTYGTRITLYRREASTFDAGQLQLNRISSFADPGIQGCPPDLDGRLFLGLAGNGASSRGAEKALTQAQLVDLPNTGAFVLPLAAHSFLVGLLVIEQIALVPHLPSGNSAVVVRHWQQDESVEEALGSGMQGDTRGVMLSGKDREIVQLAGQVLSSACAMDLHSALERAQAVMHSQQVLGLVEEVRGPLTALRTLGSILVPRLRQKEGQEIDRDVAQGILTQGDRLQEVVSQLQAAIHPVALPSDSADSFGQHHLPAAAQGTAHLQNKVSSPQTLLPPMKQDSSADDKLQK